MTSNEQVVRTEIDLPADSDEVWDALTSDSGLAPWMGEDSDIDAVPGGALSVSDIVTGRPREGRVESVDPGRELGFVWWPADDPADRSRVAIRVEPTEVGTKVVVIETLAPNTVEGVQTSAQAAWSWRGALCSVSLGARVR